MIRLNVIEFSVDGANAAEVESAAREIARRYYGDDASSLEIRAEPSVLRQDGEIVMFTATVRAVGAVK